MMKWSFDTETQRGVFAVDGDITINHVGELKSGLIEAFKNADQVVVDISAATGIDVAGVQLLCSCHRFCQGQGKSMCLKVGENERFVAFLEEIGVSDGFFCTHGEAEECLWSSLN